MDRNILLDWLIQTLLTVFSQFKLGLNYYILSHDTTMASSKTETMRPTTLTLPDILSEDSSFGACVWRNNLFRIVSTLKTNFKLGGRNMPKALPHEVVTFKRHKQLCQHIKEKVSICGTKRGVGRDVSMSIYHLKICIDTFPLFSSINMFDKL